MEKIVKITIVQDDSIATIVAILDWNKDQIVQFLQYTWWYAYCIYNYSI